VFFRVQVEAVANPLDDAFFSHAGEGHPDSRAGAKIGKRFWSKGPTPAFPVNTANNLIINTLRVHLGTFSVTDIG
jgi:hypothetical protein